jgi:hypothetical protein
MDVGGRREGLWRTVVTPSIPDRHARARRGHPRLSGRPARQDVDGRDKPGHDERDLAFRRLRHCRRAVSLRRPPRRKTPPRAIADAPKTFDYQRPRFRLAY